MLLSYYELVGLVDCGVIDALYENINGASIDVRLDNLVLFEAAPTKFVIDPSVKESHAVTTIELKDSGFILPPGGCVLASTMETFNLPNDLACEFKLKSSIARVFLNCMLATWCDPTWHNSKLTLELKNDLKHHSILLKSGMKIGQMIFYRVKPVPTEHSYKAKGRYNNTTSVTQSKGV